MHSAFGMPSFLLVNHAFEMHIPPNNANSRSHEYYITCLCKAKVLATSRDGGVELLPEMLVALVLRKVELVEASVA